MDIPLAYLTATGGFVAGSIAAIWPISAYWKWWFGHVSPSGKVAQTVTELVPIVRRLNADAWTQQELMQKVIRHLTEDVHHVSLVEQGLHQVASRLTALEQRPAIYAVDRPPEMPFQTVEQSFRHKAEADAGVQRMADAAAGDAVKKMRKRGEKAKSDAPIPIPTDGDLLNPEQFRSHEKTDKPDPPMEGPYEWQQEKFIDPPPEAPVPAVAKGLPGKYGNVPPTVPAYMPPAKNVMKL